MLVLSQGFQFTTDQLMGMGRSIALAIGKVDLENPNQQSGQLLTIVLSSVHESGSLCGCAAAVATAHQAEEEEEQEHQQVSTNREHGFRQRE